MANITLSLQDILLKMMRKHPEINWSEVARQAIQQKLKDLELLDKLTAKSKMTMKDVMELDEIVKKGLLQRQKVA